MGAGASADVAALDDEALLGVLAADVGRAKRLLDVAARAQRLLRLGPVAEALSVEALQEGTQGAQSSALAFAEGSTFGRKVEDVSTLIASRGTRLSPGLCLVLTSGGTVLDDSKPLLEQLCGEEVTYITREVSAGEAAVSLQRALASETNNADVLRDFGIATAALAEENKIAGR
ncbi:unnamed protein product [Durusdinium trenchii]|uniref:Uncharacterized protein n=1 Tax=Durusdinium trenchii TaxID=1381693 RepID=A0ABP0KPT1_9DINO